MVVWFNIGVEIVDFSKCKISLIYEGQSKSNLHKIPKNWRTVRGRWNQFYYKFHSKSYLSTYAPIRERHFSYRVINFEIPSAKKFLSSFAKYSCTAALMASSVPCEMGSQTTSLKYRSISVTVIRRSPSMRAWTMLIASSVMMLGLLLRSLSARLVRPSRKEWRHLFTTHHILRLAADRWYWRIHHAWWGNE